MSDEDNYARLRLFSAIEGGSVFWSEQIQAQGAIQILQRLEENYFSDLDHAAGNIRKRLKLFSAGQLQDQLSKSAGFMIFPSDPDWPMSVDDLSAPPIALVGLGQRTLLTEMLQSISIVGTRNPSSYGVRISGDFAIGAAEQGWTIVSGGAYGIDSAAHKGALLVEGVTVAVLAGGFDHQYPAGNVNLFREIIETGLLLSEVMPGIRAEPFRFLTRNRLIAALSKGTIVVEAAYQSGSLRTARDAAELFRLVMAVPGPINSPTSAGCHRLISERSAELVTSISEVMELVNPLGSE
jgi:DNA processing protein